MNLKDFASFALTLTLFSSLHHYNCLRRAHLHIFPHLLRHCSLLTYSNHMHAHTHTHANTFEVSDERTPTSMVGLWKRVCRRDKSVMQQMSACNNPSCQLWSSLNTHSYSMFRSHVTFSYTFCMERHIEDIQYRKTVVTGLTDGKWPAGGSSAQRMTTADSRFMYQKSPKQTSTSWCNQRIRHLILSIQHISICF